jgi:hypothetical protein
MRLKDDKADVAVNLLYVYSGGASTFIRPRLFPSRSFPIHHSSITLPFDAIY